MTKPQVSKGEERQQAATRPLLDSPPVATSARTDRTTLRTSESARFGLLTRGADIWAYREILVNLIRKDLRVKYTQSKLGAFWSMLNPILYLAIFSFVFTVVLPPTIPNFPVYLLSGLVVWNLFNGTLAIASRSIVDNTSLVKKVYFPKEILPLSSVGVTLVDFALQTLVLIVFMVVFGYPFLGLNMLLFPLALVALVLFTTAIAFWVSGLNVRYRDTQHLLNLVLLAWFWFTPIVYPAAQMEKTLSNVFGVDLFPVYLVLNPVADIVFAFQRAFYADPTPMLNGESTPVLVSLGVGQLALLMVAVIIGSAILLRITWKSFFKMAGDFAEEL